jgi:hypothetical protein
MTIPSNRQPIDYLEQQTQALNDIRAELAYLRSRVDKNSDTEQPVLLSRLDVSIGNLFIFMLKWAIASFMVTVIFGLFFGCIALLLSTVFAAGFSSLIRSIR